MIGFCRGLTSPNLSGRQNNDGCHELGGSIFPTVGEADLIRLLVGLVPYWCGVAFGGVSCLPQIVFFSRWTPGENPFLPQYPNELSLLMFWSDNSVSYCCFCCCSHSLVNVKVEVLVVIVKVLVLYTHRNKVDRFNGTSKREIWRQADRGKCHEVSCIFSPRFGASLGMVCEHVHCRTFLIYSTNNER